MKGVRQLYTIVAATALVVGCGTSGETERLEKMKEEVLAIHDEVMPRIDEVMMLKERISGQIDSLSKLPPPASLEKRQVEGARINRALTEADSLMSDWMTYYFEHADSLKSLDESGAKAFLDQEKKKITIVKEKINGSLNQARTYLKATP